MPTGIIPNTDIELNLLSGAHWSRTTIADGKWLNSNTIQPLFNNDCILSSAIHDTSADLYDRLSDASGELQNEIDDINYEIDVINAGSDVIDVVGSYQELMEYSGWTTDNDVIKVLNDEHSANKQTYYRYMDGSLDSGTLDPDSANWHYIGDVTPYYSKTEINEMSAYLQNEIDYVSDHAEYSAAYLYDLIQGTSGKTEVSGGIYVKVTKLPQKPDGMITYSADLNPDKLVDLQSDWACNVSEDPSYIKNKPSITDKVYLAEYGVATVEEISAARNAGKVVFTLIPGTAYPYVAYLREVTKNGARANFASVTSEGASVKTAWVDRDGVWRNSTVNLVPTSGSSLIQKLNYGDTEPSRVATLLIDSDDPENYALLKADNVKKGYLVIGPYKELLDSGVNGVGDNSTPIYIDSNGKFAASTGHAVTAGRNLWLNQNNEIQTNLPGGHITLDRESSELWTEVGEFGGSYALMARYNTQATTSYVQVGIRYLSSGYTAHYTFVGTQTVGSGSTVNTKIKKYINTAVVYTPQQIGDSLVDAMDPSDNDIWILEGTMDIGSLSDFRCSIWYNSSDSKYHVAFTAIEIGKIGATN